jgi:hypothetical protein
MQPHNTFTNTIVKPLQGISQIGVVTGHLRSSGTKKGFDEQRSEQILSLLNSAALSLKALPDMSAADKIVSDIVEAAHELVRSASLHPLSLITSPLFSSSPFVGGRYVAHSTSAP